MTNQYIQCPQIMKLYLTSKSQKCHSTIIFSIPLFLIFNVFFSFIAPCYPDTFENQDNTDNSTFNEVSPIDFVKCQCGEQFVDVLCEAFKGINNIPSVEKGDDITNWLNNLLEMPKLYEVLSEANTRNNYSEKVIELERRTREYRNRNLSDSSNGNAKIQAKQFNRLLLEETYPGETPKSRKDKECEYIDGIISNIKIWEQEAV